MVGVPTDAPLRLPCWLVELYGQNRRSLPQKSVIAFSELALLTASYFVLFGNRLQGVRAFGSHPSQVRNTALFGFNIVVYCRISVTLFVFLKRAIPLEEAVSVLMAFALYLIGFPLMARGADVVWGALDVVGVGLFCLGSLVNTGSEWQRYRFKQRPESSGKLFTRGLFALSMHVNYFGDLLWVSGYAAVTRNLYAVLVPSFLFVFFYFFNIPKLDAYLQGRYGSQFEDYARKTKRFIPYLL